MDAATAQAVVWVVGGVVFVVGSALGIWWEFHAERRRQQRQGEARQASRQVASQVGADPNLTTLITGEADQNGVDRTEVTRRVEEAMRWLAGVSERLEAHEASAELLRTHVRILEDRFPDASEFQKYADSNQLFLAYQLGELTKRLERVERGQLTRFQVVGIVITTLVAALAAASGAVFLLQSAHVFR